MQRLSFRDADFVQSRIGIANIVDNVHGPHLHRIDFIEVLALHSFVPCRIDLFFMKGQPADDITTTFEHKLNAFFATPPEYNASA